MMVWRSRFTPTRHQANHFLLRLRESHSGRQPAQYVVVVAAWVDVTRVKLERTPSLRRIGLTRRKGKALWQGCFAADPSGRVARRRQSFR